MAQFSMIETAVNVVKGQLRNQYFHLANGYSKRCAFGSSVTSVVGLFSPQPPKQAVISNPKAGRRDDLDESAASMLICSVLTILMVPLADVVYFK